MNKSNLLFYNAYQEFYKMAECSLCFKKYCEEAFGKDFSQDGFSDVEQIDLIFKYASLDENSHILDIGCGNGKMLQYLQKKTGATIYGFDYSENAIASAKSDINVRSNFQVGVMGEVEYPDESMDLITSMDTMYFAKDMNTLINQIHRWLKPNGLFFCGYQEGDVMPKTKNSSTTVLAKAMRDNDIKYEVIDYTKETYQMLKHKRQVITKMKADFKAEKLCRWYSIILRQTDCVKVSFDEYAKKNARYLYLFRKPVI
ncbi:MAG: class I SAM-dependent methyltransferase [Mobilitalea sp.]